MDSTLTEEQVMSLKVSELKRELGSRSLGTNGVKSALQKRLLESIKNAATSGMEVEAEKKDEEVIDESQRYTGTVVKFFKRKGFGMIAPEGKTAEDKDDLIFAHWRQIQSNDEWPALEVGQNVEYYLGKKVNPKNPKKTTFAAKITLAGGNSVTTVDTRVFPNRGQRFQGTVKFFDARKGFGFIIPKETFTFDGTEFDGGKKDGRIYIAREDIKTAAEVDTSPSLKEKAEVEFTIYKRETEKEGSKYGAGDLTKVGGEPLNTDDFKQRRTPEERAAYRKKMQKKKKKGKKRKANQMMMVPMGGMSAQPQIVMMNGQAFMMMPQNMVSGFQLPGQKKKRRRKNKNKKNKN